MFFFGVLIFSIGITRCTFCAISKIIGKGIIYCVSTGILMWCCFSLVIHSDFAYHQNFRELWVSCFFCFYTKALVQDISTTIEGTNQAAGKFSLPTPWSVRVHSRHFPNQAFCLHSALLERCDVYTPPLHASYMNVFTPHLFTQVTWTLLHPTPPHPTPSRKLHERYYTTPHPTPSPPSGTPAPKGIYIYMYICIHIGARHITFKDIWGLLSKSKRLKTRRRMTSPRPNQDWCWPKKL